MSDARDPIWGAVAKAGSAKIAKLSDHPDHVPPALVLRPAKLPNPASIPPRQWLYGTNLLRGFVTVLVAPGGTGKSSLAMTIGVALASGKSILGDHVFAKVNVAILNLEDPMDELDRRLAAILIRHRVDESEIANRLFMHSGEDRPVHMATVGGDGFQIIHPDEEALIAQIKTHNIGMLSVDPFAESHTLEENSNPHMIAAAAAWRRVARATNCAIFLIHHVRKGTVGDKGGAGIDSARGAKGLTDSARVGLLLSSMTEEEAEQAGINQDDRHQYVRLDNAKANMAPRIGNARWFQLDQVELHNGTMEYPNGDRVAAMVQWELPNPLTAQTPADLNRALDLIATGPSADVLYSASRRGGSKRWAGNILVDVCGFNEKQADKVIKQWVINGLLIEVEFRDPIARREMLGVRVDDSKRPE